jgi:hypothetical protein
VVRPFMRPESAKIKPANAIVNESTGARQVMRVSTEFATWNVMISSRCPRNCYGPFTS